MIRRMRANVKLPQLHHLPIGKKINYSAYLEMHLNQFVMIRLRFFISDYHYDLIQTGFLMIWNASVGRMVGDAEFKNRIYRYIEVFKQPDILPPQRLVDDCVDLMLEYMEEAGCYSIDYGIN